MVFTHAMMRTQYRVQLTTPGAEAAVSTPLGALAGRKPQPADSRRAGELIELFVGEAGFLVYDFSVVRPVARPFDAPAVAALDAEAR